MVNYKKAFDTCDKATAYQLNSVLDRLDEFDYDATAIDNTIATVSGSNLSATHKITRSATIVIAASDSSAKSKAQADYVCDGTADNVEIQAAIDALPVFGGKVQLLEGGYNLENSVLIEKNGVYLGGVGWNTKLLIGEAEEAGITVGATPSISNIKLEDFYIYTDAASSHGIHFKLNTQHSIISNIRMHGIRGNGINFESTNIADGNHWNIIDSCIMSSFYGHGVSLGTGSNMVHINNCRFYNQLSDSTRFAINVQSCDAAIHGNRMHQCEGGIALRNASCETFTVIGNYMQNIHRTGILMQNGAQHGIVQGNTIYYPSDRYNNFYSGIEMEDTIDTIVSGNIVKGSLSGNKPKYGILLKNTYSTAVDNIITGNRLENCASATIIPLTNNIIRNNRGYINDNVGTATITTGQTTVDVTHGLAAAPTRVIISPTTATAGKQFYVSAKAATTFTITIDSAAEAEISFDWQAMI